MSVKFPIILGLTGSIGMGKTTTAKIFADNGIPVWDADTAVHYLYKHDARTLKAFNSIIPQVVKENQVNRNELKKFILAQEGNLKKIEAIIHPLVAKDRESFLLKHQEKKTRLVVLDIPLLFETKNENLVDYIVVVTVDPKIQRKRVLERKTMSEKMFDNILANQLSDKEKQNRADFIISTKTKKVACKSVLEIISNFSDG